LLFGSGFHAQHALRVSPGTPAWAREFDEWAASALSRLDVDALLDFRARAPAVDQGPATWEHYAPVLVAAGAVADRPAQARFPITGFWMDGAFTRRSVQFGCTCIRFLAARSDAVVLVAQVALEGREVVGARQPEEEGAKLEVLAVAISAKRWAWCRCRNLPTRSRQCPGSAQ